MTQSTSSGDGITADEATAPRAEREGWLSRGVLGVGSASLFSDASHELVTSLLPSFLTVSLHAGPASLGVIEGASDALTGVAKLVGGPLANDPRRRGRLASGGYLGTAVATAAIGLTDAVWQVGLLRAIAWVSRGIRSPSRDMLLTSLVTKQTYGRAFGIERAGDNAGAILGPVLASVLVGWLGLRHAILLSFIPGVLAAVSITLAARQARHAFGEQPAKRTLQLQWGRLRRAGLGRVLLPVACFELGNVATTLLILRATGLLTSGGRSLTAATSVAILLYAGHNAVAAGTSLLAGQLSDRRSPRLVFVLGAVVYAAGYGLLAVGVHGWPLLLAAFALARDGDRVRRDRRVDRRGAGAARGAPRQRLRRARTHPGPRRSRLHRRGRHPLVGDLAGGRVRLRRRLDGRRPDHRPAARPAPASLQPGLTDHSHPPTTSRP